MSDVEDGSRHLPDWEQEVYRLREQVAAMRAENERLRAEAEQLIAMVEARAKRAREKADSKDPKKEVYAAIADAEACSLESMAEWLRAFMAAKEGE